MMVTFLTLVLLDVLFHCVILSFELSNPLESAVNDYFTELMADPYFRQPSLKFEIEKLFKEYKEYIQNHSHINLGGSSFSNSTVETFEDYMTIPAPFPATIELFTVPDDALIHAVSLEATGVNPQITDVMEMVLRVYNETQDLWTKVDSVLVRNAMQLEIQNVDAVILVFLLAHDINGEPRLSIYFVSSSRFSLSQALTVGQIDCFTVWDEPNNNDIYLGVVSNVYGDHVSCSLYLYRWANNNFLLFDIIPTFCATAIKSFLVDSIGFLAVCHRSDISDKTGAESYTTLYKFNDETKSFQIHQIIPISDCINIEYVEFKSSDDSILKNFIVFVCFDGKGQQNSTSMIFKFYNEYFNPYQIITANDVHQWLAYESTDQSFLLAATRFSGIRMFGYDAGSFVELGILKESTFISHVSKCSVDDTAVLVIADKGNDGTHSNVFQIPTADENMIGETEDIFYEWYSEVALKLESLSELRDLEEKIRSAPKVDSAEIIINGTLEFFSIDSDSLILAQSLPNSINDTREERFAEDLENKLSELKIIENFVHKLVSSNGKFIVNGDLFLNDFMVNCTEECDLNILSISNLNGEDFDELVANTINIDTSNNFEAALDFENIAVSLHLLPERINQHLMSSLVHRRREILFMNGLKLDSIVVSKTLNVSGLIDGTRMEPDSVLLISKDQSLNGTLLFEKGNIDNLYYNQSLIKNTEFCSDHNATSIEVNF